MRLKKFLALMLVGCLTFSIAACGESKDDDNGNNNNVNADANNNNNSDNDDVDNNENDSESEKESENGSDKETDAGNKDAITEKDASTAAVKFAEALMKGDKDAAKKYFPYNMTDEEWEKATGALGSFSSMNGKEMEVTDGIKAKMYFELKFDASDAKKVSNDELAELKSSIEKSQMSDMASYDFEDISAVYVIAVVMSMDVWVDDWSIDSSVVTMTDEQIEALKKLTDEGLKEQSAGNKMGFAFCVADIDGESKVIIFETISED